MRRSANTGLYVKVALLGAAFAALAFSSGKAYAVDGEGIAASPYNVTQSLEAGATFTGELTITNPGSSGYEFQLSSEPFAVEGEDYRHTFILKPGVTDPSKWFTFPTSRYRLEPGQSLKVPYQIQVPKEASPGGHYAVVFAETLTDAKNSQGVASRKRVGVIFYTTIAGEFQKRGSVADFKTSFWQAKPPLTTELRMKNDGNAHYDAQVKLKISDLFGNTKATLNDNRKILPQTIRRYNLVWKEAPAFGLFKVGGTAKIFDKTHELPTRYVLIIGKPYLFMMLLGALILLGLAILTAQRTKPKHRVPRA